MGIATHKKAAIVTGILMGVLVPFGAMMLSSEHTNAAILVYDAKNVEQAIKEAIQTKNIWGEEEAQTQIGKINIKSLNPDQFLNILQGMLAAEQDGGFCKTNKIDPEILKQSDKEPGFLNDCTKRGMEILYAKMGSVSDIFKGTQKTVDPYEATTMSLKTVEQTNVDAVSAAKGAKISDEQLAQSIQTALDASNNAEGTKQVMQAGNAIAAMHAMETRNGNEILANLVAQEAANSYQQNMERAAMEKRMQDSKVALNVYVSSFK